MSDPSSTDELCLCVNSYDTNMVLSEWSVVDEFNDLLERVVNSIGLFVNIMGLNFNRTSNRL